MTETNSTSAAAFKQTKGVIKGRDVHEAVTVSFKESALGCTKEVSITRNENCQSCEGTGAKPKAVQAKCTVCNGTGHIVERVNDIKIVQIDCEDCQGMGYTVPACLSCSGLGSIRAQVTEKITIPAGVYSGLILRSQGKGN